MSAAQTGESPDIAVAVEGLVKTYGEGENAAAPSGGRQTRPVWRPPHT